MAENKAKGDLFQHVLAYVNKKWGKEGLDILKQKADSYHPQEWYPLSDFCSLLTDIDMRLGKEERGVIIKMGSDMMTNDFRWKTIFTGRNPEYVFLSTKRQQTQYSGGTHFARIEAANHIRIELSGWGTDPIWYVFYKGRLQGVLELTGYDGSVDMSHADDDKYFYDVKWK